MDATSNHLSIYLDRIHTFLIHDAKSQVFSDLTMAMEDVLVNIAQNADYLKNGMFDDDCKYLAARIIEVLERNKQIYTLTYAFENDESKKVMVYKKTPVPLVMKPIGLTQLRKPKTIPNTNVSVGTHTNTVMSSFKTSSLNATLKFVKDDSRLVLQYPDMSTEQTEFVKQMISQCMTQTDGTDTGPGSKGLFDPLAEALKIFSLKYDFKLSNAVPSSFDMKRLVFEKIPKQSKNKIEKDIKTVNSTSEGNQLKPIQPLRETVLEEFEKQSFLQIRNFLTQTGDCLTFENITVVKAEFLTSWKTCVKPGIITFFSKEVQKILCEIRELIKSSHEKFTVHTTMQKISNTHSTVYLEKKWTNYSENAVLCTRKIEQKVQVPKDIAEMNNNKPLNPIPIDKVNTVTEKVIETRSNSMFIAKVKKDIAEENNNKPLNPIPIEKVNTLTEKVIETRSNSMFIAKVKKDIAEENNKKPLNPIPIEKVNTVTLKVNTQANSIPVAKVNTNSWSNSMPVEKVITRKESDENTAVNSMFLKNKDYTLEVNNNTQANSMLIGKVNTENRHLDKDDFIAIRQTCGPPTPIGPLKNKLRSLNTAVSEIDGKFVRQAIIDLKDFICGTKETLSFKELRREELEFLIRWEDVIKRVEIIRMFSIPGQMALDELRTMVEMSSGSFKIVVSSKTASPTNRTVTFQKQKNKKKKPNAASKTTPERSDELPISNTSLKTKPTEHKIIQEIPQSWEKNTLILLKDFLEDDLQASLLVPSVTVTQKDFLVRWQSVLSRREEDGFREDMQRILKDLRQSVAEKAHIFGISLKVSKIKNGSRDATFIKMPSFALQSSQKEENLKETMAENSKPKNNGSKTEIPNMSRRLRELENSAAEKNQPNCAGNKDEIAVSGIAPVKSDASRSIPKAASVTSLPVKPHVEAKGRPHSASSAKAILIEALNQPLVSERGLKMMRMMGWEGGALGARGDGIVEPIALNLDSTRRAGLGLKLPPKKSKLQVTTSLPPIIIRRTVPHSPPVDVMRTIILQIIEEMLNKQKEVDILEDLASELVSPANFTKKTYKFIRQILTAFNSRTLTIDLPQSPIILRIMDLIQKTDLVITACNAASQKNILFVLSKDIYQPSEDDSKIWCSSINMENVPKSRKTAVRNDDNILVDGEVFKDFVMEQILRFCEKSIDTDKKLPRNRISQEIPLRGTMALKQISYIQDVIVRLNAKSRASSDMRQKIFDEIVMKMRDFDLHVDFPTAKNSSDYPVYKCIHLHKIFYKKPNSSATDKAILGTADKISINSMVSINKLLKTKTSEADIINAKNNTENQKTEDKGKEKDCNTITNDTCEENDRNAPKNNKNTSIDNKNAQDNSKNNISNEKNNDERKGRRTTFTNDSFDEKCLFDYQNTHIDSQNAAIGSQSSQNAPIDSQNAAMGSESSQIAPMTSQNAAMSSQNSEIAPMTGQNELLDEYEKSIFNDCLCCKQDYCSPDASVTKNGDNMEINIEKATENKATYKPNAEKKDSHRQSESDKEGTQNVDGTSVISENSRVQYFSIKGLKTLIDDCFSNMECTEEVKKTLAEFKNNIFLQISEKQKLEMPKDNLQQNTDKNLSKRLRSNPSTPDRNFKKFKNSKIVIKISVTPNDYPQSQITDEKAGEIQKSILNSIDYTEELPLLECHGIQDGALVYTCHNKQTFNLIDSITQSMRLQVNLEERDTCHRMTVRINSFIDESIDTILERLETYNTNVYTKDWNVLKLEKNHNFIVIHVEIDECSFELVVKENFTLYAGIDQAKFSIVWD